MVLITQKINRGQRGELILRKEESGRNKKENKGANSILQ